MTPAGPVPLFTFEHVGLTAGATTILHDVHTTIAGAGITAVVGPSGAGKSSLLRLCNRLEAPTRGRVLFRGDDLAGLDVLAHRRRVGMVFQRPVLFPGTVRDNLRVAVAQATEDEMAAALERAHLPATFLDRAGDDLSGGEAQRACLARTLLPRPQVLLMDEPTSALDAPAARVLEVLVRGLADAGVPVVWVSHDEAQVGRLADHTLAVAAGRVVDPSGRVADGR